MTITIYKLYLSNSQVRLASNEHKNRNAYCYCHGVPHRNYSTTSGTRATRIVLSRGPEVTTETQIEETNGSLRL